MLRAEDVALIMGCSLGHAYRLMRTGVIPAVKINGARRVPRAALSAWLEQQNEAALRQCGGGGDSAA